MLSNYCEVLFSSSGTQVQTQHFEHRLKQTPNGRETASEL